MSTNKKFRVQNGLDVTGEVVVGGITVINADGTVVSDVSDQLVPLQADVSALETAVENIIGTSPETLDTLQEIVAAYEGADADLQLLVAQTNQSVADLQNSVGAGASLITPETPITVMVPGEFPTALDGHLIAINGDEVRLYNAKTGANLANFYANMSQGGQAFLSKNYLFIYNPNGSTYEARDLTQPGYPSLGNLTHIQPYVTDGSETYRIWRWSSDLDGFIISHRYNQNSTQTATYLWKPDTDINSVPVKIHSHLMVGNAVYNGNYKEAVYDNGKLLIWRGGNYNNTDGIYVMDWAGDPSVDPTNLHFLSSYLLGDDSDNEKYRYTFRDALIVGNNLVVAVSRNANHGMGWIAVYDLTDLSAEPKVMSTGIKTKTLRRYDSVSGDTFVFYGPFNSDHKTISFIRFDSDNVLQGVDVSSNQPAERYGQQWNMIAGTLSTTQGVYYFDVVGTTAAVTGHGVVWLYDLTALDTYTGTPSLNPTTTLQGSGNNGFGQRANFAAPTVYEYQYSPEVIVPNSGVVPAINYLEDKTNDMQAEINGLSGTDTSLTTSVAANAAAITANTAAIAAEATARQTAIDAIPAPDLSSYATSASVTAGDLALQDQIDAIVGTSPETLDTLQEVVAAFEGADGDLQTLMTANSSAISTLDAFVGDGATTNLVVPSNWQGNGGNTVTVSPNGDLEYSSDGGPTKVIQTVTLPADTTITVSMNVASDNIPSLDHGRHFIIVPTGLNSGTTSNHVIANARDAGYNFTSSSTTSQYDTFGAQTIAGPVPNEPFNSGGNFTLSWYNENEIVVDILFSQGSTDAEYGGHNWFITDLFVGDASSTLSLETSASTVVGAINEVHTELQALSGADTSIVGDVATNTQAIADEVARATAAEAALAADIAAESSARSAKGNTQDTNIAANATAISNEVTRATAAEQANTAAIVVEAAARAAADSDLSASISAISSGVNTGDLTVTGSATFESGINVGSNGGSIGYDDTSEDIQMMSDVDMSGNLIHNLGTPVASTDAASKSYVDGRIGDVIGGSVESLDTIKEVVDAFQNADSDIQSLITANSTSVSANTTAIGAETTRAQAAEASLQSQITASVSDTSDLDSDVQANAAAIAVNASNHSTLETFVKGSGPEISTSEWTEGNPVGGVHYISTPRVVLPAGSWTFNSEWTGPSGLAPTFFIMPTSWNGDGMSNMSEALFTSGPQSANGSYTQTFSYSQDVLLVVNTTLVDSNQVGGSLVTFSKAELISGSGTPLETTATQVVPAINELVAAVADTSGITAAFQAADSDVTAAFQAADASLQAQIDAGAFDGSAIDQNLVPATTDTYSLGTPDKVWKDLYIGPGSLYLNGTKILEDNSGTITMYADAGQNLSFGATGGGSIDLNAGDESIQIKSDLVLSVGETISTVGGASTRFGGSVNMQTHKIENVGAPTADLDVATKLYVDTLIAAGTVSGDRTFDSNVIVEGNLTVSGTTTTVNSETISLADNIIDLNSNLTSGAPTEHAGIRVLRGDESAVQVRWNETSDHWEVYNGSAWTKIALDTDDLAEGSTNLYFTEVRARGCVSADDNSCIDYNESTGKFSLDVAETEAAITPDSAKDADKLDGQHGSYYRINVYDANGALVN